jgi:aspartate/methionine/tyrosine aminotransferase
MKPRPFLLERYFALHEFTTRYLLCASDCETLTIQELLELEPGAGDELFRLPLGYTETRGSPRLREVVAELYTDLGPDDILIHAGAEEAIFTTMNALVEPGDHVIVHTPRYQSLGDVAAALGAEVTPWNADPARDWQLDLDDLMGLLRKNTKVVVVNLPHNPTGWLPDADFQSELAALADREGFVIFSDEVYRGLEYDPNHRLPAFCDLCPNAVSLGVMSKTYGLAGLRIGWIATQNRQLLQEVADLKDYTTICSSAPSEFLATVALRNRDRIVERNLDLIRENLAHCDRFFGKFEELFDWRRPYAGPIAFPRYLGEPVQDFCNWARQECGVLLLPGTLYENRDNCFRIGFGRADAPSALQALEGGLERRT